MRVGLICLGRRLVEAHGAVRKAPAMVRIRSACPSDYTINVLARRAASRGRYSAGSGVERPHTIGVGQNGPLALVPGPG